MVTFLQSFRKTILYLCLKQPPKLNVEKLFFCFGGSFMAQLWFVGQQIGELNFTACKFVPSGIIAHTSYMSEMCTITIISRLLFHSGTSVYKRNTIK